MKPSLATYLILTALHWIDSAIYAARTQAAARRNRRDLLEEWWRDRKLANAKHARAALQQYRRLQRQITTPRDIIID